MGKKGPTFYIQILVGFFAYMLIK